ncbi:prenyltransferase, partial [Candidatus Heimdallarchaeota archaeon]
MLEQAQNFLISNSKLTLLTRSYKNRNEVQVSYIFENSKIFLIGRSDNIHIEHIKYNHKVVLKIKNQNQNLIIRAWAQISKDSQLKEKYLDILAEKDGITPQGIYDLKLVEIIPLELHSQDMNINQIYQENHPSKISFFFTKVTKTLQFWIRATRLPFVSVSVMGVIVGTAVSFNQFEFMDSWLNFILTFLGIMFFHICIDLLNDYSDHKSGLDEINVQQTPFSGGSRIIQNKLLAPSLVLLVALTSLSFCIGIGLYLNFTVANNIILLIG